MPGNPHVGITAYRYGSAHSLEEVSCGLRRGADSVPPSSNASASGGRGAPATAIREAASARRLPRREIGRRRGRARRLYKELCRAVIRYVDFGVDF